MGRERGDMKSDYKTDYEQREAERKAKTYTEQRMASGSIYRKLAASDIRKLDASDILSYPESVDIDEMKSGTAYVVVRDASGVDIAHLEFAPDAWRAFKDSIIAAAHDDANCVSGHDVPNQPCQMIPECGGL